jgi:hypothetical protein
MAWLGQKGVHDGRKDTVRGRWTDARWHGDCAALFRCPVRSRTVYPGPRWEEDEDGLSGLRPSRRDGSPTEPTAPCHTWPPAKAACRRHFRQTSTQTLQCVPTALSASAPLLDVGSEHLHGCTCAHITIWDAITGEVFRGISELHARYGVDGDIADEHYVWHTTWREERRSRGVLATGTYVVKAGSCPLTGRIVFVDAEDPIISSWQRYINHSAKRPNLVMSSVVLPDGEPLVCFRVERDVQPGDE